MKSATQNRGFSLVEVLVAITILLLVMVGPMRVLTQVTNSTAFSTEQTTAFFLAQEGIELAQMARDRVILEEINEQLTVPLANQQIVPWTRYQNLYMAPCFQPAGCGLTPTRSGSGPFLATTSCAVIGNCQLFLNNSTNPRDRYTHIQTGNQPTIFTRVIRMSMLSGSPVRGVIATSTVTWRTGSMREAQQVELVTVLANVYGY